MTLQLTPILHFHAIDPDGDEMYVRSYLGSPHNHLICLINETGNAACLLNVKQAEELLTLLSAFVNQQHTAPSRPPTRREEIDGCLEDGR